MYDPVFVYAALYERGKIAKVPGLDLKDPRPDRRGPLPKDWARYQGLYLDGDKVILSYTVGGCPVLEMPGLLESGAK